MPTDRMGTESTVNIKALSPRSTESEAGDSMSAL